MRNQGLKMDDSDRPSSLAATPPLGWNSWNAFHDTSAEILKRTADNMVSLGLRDAGYQFVNSDDAWMLQHHHPIVLSHNVFFRFFTLAQIVQFRGGGKALVPRRACSGQTCEEGLQEVIQPGSDAP